MFEVKRRIIHDTGGQFSQGDVTDRPAPTVVQSCPSFYVEYRLSSTPPHMTPSTALLKPPYQVPSMDQVKQIPWNGFTVVSTFSGCGGSALGYRMAGFKVLWSNEFIPAAQECYQLNHPSAYLDKRDIRQIQPEEILEQTGKEKGEIDLYDGSPPCAAFSTAGKRHAGWGQVKQYSDTKQRVDDLFFEYARLLRGLQPKVFVAENVSGLVKGTAKGYFKEILKTLKDCGYRVQAKLLDAQWLGVPQARQRLIFVGVRNDLGLDPIHPAPLGHRYTVREAIPWITQIKLGGSPDNWHSADRPAGTVTQSDGARESLTGYLSSYLVEAETDISHYAIAQEWNKLKPGEQSNKYFNLVKPDLELPWDTATQMGGGRSVASVVHPVERRKFSIAELKRICAFPDDFVLTGSYTQQWERLGRAVPPVMMSQIARTIQTEILDKCAA